MAGDLVPLVMMPRYTTLSGAMDFTTIGMEVADYTAAILNVFRGPVSDSGTFAVNFEESTDQQTWSTCSGTSTDYDPGSGTEGQVTATLKKRWFRVRVTLTGTGATVSCWMLGFLEMRQS